MRLLLAKPNSGFSGIRRDEDDMVLLKFWTFSGENCPKIFIVGVREIYTEQYNIAAIGKEFVDYKLFYFNDKYELIDDVDSIVFSGCGKIDRNGNVSGYSIGPTNEEEVRKIYRKYKFDYSTAIPWQER